MYDWYVNTHVQTHLTYMYMYVYDNLPPHWRKDTITPKWTVNFVVVHMLYCRCTHSHSRLSTCTHVVKFSYK